MERSTEKEAGPCPRARTCNLRTSKRSLIETQLLAYFSAAGLSHRQRERVLASSVPLIADLMLAMDLLDDAVILVHEDGRMIHWNHAATILALPGKLAAIHSLQMLGPSEPWGSCRQLLRDYQTQSGFLGREIRDPGSGKCWDLKLTSLAYLGATARRLVLVIRDVTEDVRTREKLNEGEVMAATGALLAGAAHQAKNATFGLSATLDAFEAHLEGEAVDRACVRHMRQGIAHMQVLMRDLLDYGNPCISGDSQLTPLSATVRRSIHNCQALARASSVEILTETEEDSTVAGNPSQLARAIENLLENAIQHSPPNGTVTARIARSRDCVRLDITDKGPGFPPEQMGKLFTPFFTLRPEGTGLGLTIAKKIVEDLRGAIRLSNSAGGGAQVTIFLPMARESTSEPATACSGA